MIRYHQTKFGSGHGNCFPTCLACLLEIKPDRVPRYNKDYRDWLQKYNEWLAQFGLSYVEWDWPFESEVYIRKDHYVILAGQSPRDENTQHAVVGELTVDQEEERFTVDVCHDPHPSGDEIETLDQVGFILRRFKADE